MDYKPQTGDFFLCDSDNVAPRIVKFLQQSPTIYQQIWRYFRGTLETVRYYHAGMVLNETQIIEQQTKVQLADINKIYNRDIVIYRIQGLNDFDRERIKNIALIDLGKGYDVSLILGKTLTWLTGIQFFQVLGGKLSPNAEICVSRVAEWLYEYCDFGVNYHGSVTTKIQDEYCQNNPSKIIEVYKHE
jgi:hypothetical protein